MKSPWRHIRFAALLVLATCVAEGAIAAEPMAQAPANENPRLDKFREAIALYTGDGVEQDRGRARELLAELAQQGFSVAQYMYARMLLSGEGGPPDSEEGVRFLQLAVVQQNPAATTLLGDLFRTGNGVAQDASRAAQYYQLAANQGYAVAQNLLGTSYNQGIGVTEDPAEAARWFLRSANQGNALAMRNLAILYVTGRGVDADLGRAYAWLEIALRAYPEGSSAHETVARIREGLETQLSPEQLGEAERFVRGWSATPEHG